jgi:hypothetical protein
VAEESRNKHYLPCVSIGIRNSLLECVGVVLLLCTTAEHTNRELSEQVANLLDQLGVHTLHLASTAGSSPCHAATHQGEENWYVHLEQEWPSEILQ